MLPYLFVQISAAIALAASLLGFLVGLSRRRKPGGAVGDVAKTAPARGTQLLWIVGTLLAVFWPVGIFLLPTYAYHWPALPDFAFSWAVQLVGVALGVSGGLLYSRSARALGSQMTPVIQVQRNLPFVRTGPYRLIRHPVYTAILLIGLGQTLLFLSVPAALLTLLLAGLAVYRARLEEGLLGSPAGFGRAYTSYAARTGWFFPRRQTQR